MKLYEIVPFICEAAVPNVDNKGIPRHKMPQIKSEPEEREKFFEYLRGKKIQVLDTMYAVRDLKPTQKEFNTEKIDSLMEDFEPTTNPILVSRDGYILDGHHRWAAAWNLKLEEMAVQALGQPLEEALDTMRDYPDVFFVNIHEWMEPDKNLQQYGVPDDSTMPAYNMKKVHKHGRDMYLPKNSGMQPGKADWGIYENRRLLPE